MTKNEYLNNLKSYLNSLPDEEIREILLDYEEHFIIGREKGKTEDEIAEELGTPKEVADSILQSLGAEHAKPVKEVKPATPVDSTRKTLITILLVALNLMFVLPPFMGVIGFLIGVFAAGAGIAVGGVGVLIGLPVTFFVPGFVPGILTTISFGIGLICLGILTVILGVALSKLLYRITSSYISWNKKLVNG